MADQSETFQSLEGYPRPSFGPSWVEQGLRLIQAACGIPRALLSGGVDSPSPSTPEPTSYVPSQTRPANSVSKRRLSSGSTGSSATSP